MYALTQIEHCLAQALSVRQGRGEIITTGHYGARDDGPPTSVSGDGVRKPCAFSCYIAIPYMFMWYCIRGVCFRVEIYPRCALLGAIDHPVIPKEIFGSFLNEGGVGYILRGVFRCRTVLPAHSTFRALAVFMSDLQNPCPTQSIFVERRWLASFELLRCG